MTDAGVPVTACPFDGPHHPHGAEPRQQLLEEHPQLQPCQIGAQAIMHSLTETQVRVGLTSDIEFTGALEHAGVTIGRALPHLDLLPSLDELSAERDIAR